MPQRRAVITGMGVVAANGSTHDEFWRAIRDGVSPARVVTRFEIGSIPCRFAAEIDDFDAARYMDGKRARRLNRSIALGVAAAAQAWRDGGLDECALDSERIGVIEGTSLSNVETAYKGRASYDRKGYHGVSPSAMLNGHFGSGSAEIALTFGLRSSAMSSSTSSSSGNDVLGAAFRTIRDDEADIMLAGGAEAPIIDTVWTGFCQLHAMSRRQSEPGRAMRPFDSGSDGFVLGEGAAYLVVEELSHALARGARIYAEVAGYGRYSEAYHGMAPEENGLGARKSLEQAFLDARVPLRETDYINAHGSANRPSDQAECNAVRDFFGRHADRIAIGSTKPVTGHTLSSVGALEAVVCALSIHRQCIPATLNLEQPIADDLDLISGAARAYPVRSAVNLNSGFGGKNSCLILRACGDGPS